MTPFLEQRKLKGKRDDKTPFKPKAETKLIITSMLGRIKKIEKRESKNFFRKKIFFAKKRAKIRAKKRLIKRLSKESKSEFFINLRKYREEKNSKKAFWLRALTE